MIEKKIPLVEKLLKSHYPQIEFNVKLFIYSNKLNYFHNLHFRDKLKKVYQPTSQIGDTQCN